MAVDPVPWFVGGGAQHSPEVARLLAYMACRGNEGVLAAGDLKVLPLTVPGAAVRVVSGAASIINRAAGGAGQAYVGRIASEETLTVAATGSGGGRSDLVVFRVEDPWLAGEPWPDPSDPVVGPYISPRVISGVPGGTTTVTQLGLGYSAIPLARIDLPSSTGTVDAAKIIDLRRVANPRRERRVDVRYPTATWSALDATWRHLDTSASMFVPAWATQAKLIITAFGLAVRDDDFYGNLRGSIGPAGYPRPAGTVFTQNTVVDESDPTTGWDRRTYGVAAELTVPAAMRGSNVTCVLEGWRNNSAGALGLLTCDTGSTVVYDVEFLEVPE